MGEKMSYSPGIRVEVKQNSARMSTLSWRAGARPEKGNNHFHNKPRLKIT
jgi:hypothetical protein